MIKVSLFQGSEEYGPAAVPLFGAADSYFEKVASASLLPEVSTYIAQLQPRNDSQYVLVNAMGAGEYYGCFPAGTLITTEVGEVPIETVTVGSLARTHKNRMRRVDAVQRKEYRGGLTEVRLQCFPTIVPALTATEKHEVWAIDAVQFAAKRHSLLFHNADGGPLPQRRLQFMRALEPGWVPIGELRRGDYVCHPFPLEEDPLALGDGWDDPDLAFAFGLYAAEGCISYSYKTTYDDGDRSWHPLKGVVYVLSETEVDLAQHLRDIFDRYGRVARISKNESDHSLRVEVSWQAFAETCRRNFGEHAPTKTLSGDVLRMPRHWQREMFLAYSKGDGYEVLQRARGAGSFRNSSASYRLLCQMRLLLARLDVSSSVSGRYNTRATWFSGRPIYELLVGGSQLHGGTERKAKSYIHPGGFILSRVLSVRTEYWEGPVYDLQVDEDSSFVASTVAVHNSNVNGDRFSEEALIHSPNDWKGIPVYDKVKSADWAYGFPTFYGAHVFPHHRNKDAKRALGFVELAAWNPHMKRVELVTRLDNALCLKFGGEGIWDKLKAGMFPDVSMGTKVPFDTCFPAGTLVRTARGNVPIEQVLVGDLVLTHTGKYSPVTSLLCREDVALRRLDAAGLPPISTTDCHPFLAVPAEAVRSCKGWNSGRRERHVVLQGTCPRCTEEVNVVPDWIPASELRVGDYLAVPVARESSVIEIDARLARTLGYYLGDGYVIRQRTGKRKDGEYRDMGVGFSVGTAESEHLERLTSTLLAITSANSPNVYDAGAGRAAYIVSLYDQELAAWLLLHGGKTCEAKRLSSDVFRWQDEAKLELVAGYIDTDGCFSEGTGQVRISSVNRGLLLDVQRVVLSLGLHCAVGYAGAPGGYANSKDVWQLILPGSQAQAFLGRSTKIREKEFRHSSSQMLFCGDYWLTPVKVLEEVDESAVVYNLSVEGDESYVAEGRAVHNCSITLDKALYYKARATYDPKKHKSPGEAILEYHKKLKAKDGVGIRGVSITRADYSEYARTRMNFILPDGRKVWVDNDFPKFFDISYVFMGADRIAKAMLKIADAGRVYYFMGSAELAEKLGMSDDDDVQEKTAASKQATPKSAEMNKEVIPNQLAGKAVPLLTANEPDLPQDVLGAMGAAGLDSALTTSAGLGMVLRPREFQRITLICLGKRDVADQLDALGQVFPKVEERDPLPMEGSSFSPGLASILAPLLGDRSAFGPVIERRVVIVAGTTPKDTKKDTSHSSELLRKIGAAYNGYRDSLMQFVPEAQDLIEASTSPSDATLRKLAGVPAEELFTPLSVQYLTHAFLDELGTPDQEVVKHAHASVQRVLPLATTQHQQRVGVLQS